MPFRHFPSACLSLFLLSACGGAGDHSESGAEGTTTSALTMDTHSAARPNEAVIQHLDLDIKVDMEAQRIEGSATYALKPGHGPLVRFDTDGLTLHDVKDANSSPRPGHPHAHLDPDAGQSRYPVHLCGESDRPSHLMALMSA
jgi:hypothetical protein